MFEKMCCGEEHPGRPDVDLPLQKIIPEKGEVERPNITTIRGGLKIIKEEENRGKREINKKPTIH